MKKIKRPELITPSVTHDLRLFMESCPTTSPRVLIADIETSMMLGYFFGMWKQNIGVDCIIQDWNILSFSAKWLGSPTVLYQSLREQKNPVNDKGLCQSLHTILNNTDVVVAHNGKRFDMKKIRARMALNRMPPIPDVRIIDTLLESRKQFGFTSQTLMYLSDKFGPDGLKKYDHGKFAGRALWIACQSGDQDAWDEMEAYNVPDVTSLEGVYLELRPWFQGAQNLGVFGEAHEGHTCPNCGGHHVKKDGKRHTQVGVYQQYKCLDCGGYSRGRIMIRSHDERKHILMN